MLLYLQTHSLLIIDKNTYRKRNRQTDSQTGAQTDRQIDRHPIMETCTPVIDG